MGTYPSFLFSLASKSSQNGSPLRLGLYRKDSGRIYGPRFAIGMENPSNGKFGLNIFPRHSSDWHRCEIQGRRLSSLRKTVFAPVQRKMPAKRKRSPFTTSWKKSLTSLRVTGSREGAGLSVVPGCLGKTINVSRGPLVQTDAANMLKQARLPVHYSPHSFPADRHHELSGK